MRDSNSHGLRPAVFETAPSTFIGIPSESLSHPLRGFGFPAIPHIMVLKNRLRYADGFKNFLDFCSLYTEICPHSKTLLVSEEKQ